MQGIVERNLAALRARLDAPAFDAAWAVGRLTLAERIVEEALDDDAAAALIGSRESGA
jgi:hypothetical protein